MIYEFDGVKFESETRMKADVGGIALAVEPDSGNMPYKASASSPGWPDYESVHRGGGSPDDALRRLFARLDELAWPGWRTHVATQAQTPQRPRPLPWWRRALAVFGRRAGAR